ARRGKRVAGPRPRLVGPVHEAALLEMQPDPRQRPLDGSLVVFCALAARPIPANIGGGAARKKRQARTLVIGLLAVGLCFMWLLAVRLISGGLPNHAD